MAISARMQLLQARRKEAAIFERFAGRRRVLSPYGSLRGQTSTIARRTLSAEIEAKERLYRDGQVTNEEMQTFYQGLLINPLLTPLEKVGIQDNLRDFNDRVRLSALEAAYRQSPDNSLQRIQTAQSLADYYRNKATGMIPETPAHSSMIEEAGRWEGIVASETAQVQRQARANRRAQLEYEVAFQPHNSSERAQAKAQAFMELYNMAVADGDTLAANRLLTQAQEQQTLARELAEREAERGEAETKRTERKAIVNAINTLADQYHDGKITAQQFAQAIPALEERAVALGDVSIQLNLNKWADSLAKDIQRGVRRGIIGDLPIVLGKGGRGGTGGGVETNWDKEDYNYSDNLRLFQAAFNAGDSTPQQYAENVALAIQERAGQIAQRLQTIKAIAEENPNKPVYYDGRRRRATDVLDALYKEWDSLEEQAGAINKGNFALLEVPPTEGVELGKGKSIVTYKLIDPTTFEEGTIVPDKEGVYRELYKPRVYLSPEEAQKATLTPMGLNVYTDPQTGKTYNLQADEAGRLYYSPPGKQFYRVYWAGSNKFTELEYKPREFAKTREEIQEEAERAYEEAAKAKEKEKEVKIPEPTLMERIFGPKVVSPIPEEQILKPKPVREKVKEAVKPVVEKALEVVKPAAPVIRKIVGEAPPFKAEEQVKITEPIRIAQPPVRPLVVTPAVAYRDAEAVRKEAEKLKLAVPPTTALQKQAEKGFKIQLGPEFAPPPPPKPQEPWWKKLKSLATQIWPFKR